MISAELKVASGEQTGTVIPLARKFLIGREQDCQLRPGSEEVSRHHCVITVDDYTVRVRDLGSTNGTFVNGERIRGETGVKSGDVVKIGQIELEVYIHDESSDTEAAAAEDFDRDEFDALAEAAGLASPSSSDPATDTVYALPAMEDQDSASGQTPSEGDTSIVRAADASGQASIAAAPHGTPPGMATGQPGQKPAAAYSAPTRPIIPVRLPDPETTGVKEEVRADSGQENKTASEAESTAGTAAEIIRQFMQQGRPDQPGSGDSGSKKKKR